jgi:glutamate dehydrogenase (NAD(P)+)
MAFAVDARYSVFPVEKQPVFEAISSRLRANTLTVLDDAARVDVTTHAAAQRLAEERVRAAMQLGDRPSRAAIIL